MYTSAAFTSWSLPLSIPGTPHRIGSKKGDVSSHTCKPSPINCSRGSGCPRSDWIPHQPKSERTHPMQYSASMQVHHSPDNLMYKPQQIHTHRYLVSHHHRPHHPRALEQRSEAVATTKLAHKEPRLLPHRATRTIQRQYVQMTKRIPQLNNKRLPRHTVCQHLDDDCEFPPMTEVRAEKYPMPVLCVRMTSYVCVPATAQAVITMTYTVIVQLGGSGAPTAPAPSPSPPYSTSPQGCIILVVEGTQLMRQVPLCLHRQHRRLPKPRSSWRKTRAKRVTTTKTETPRIHLRQKCMEPKTRGRGCLRGTLAGARVRTMT